MENMELIDLTLNEIRRSAAMIDRAGNEAAIFCGYQKNDTLKRTAEIMIKS